MRRPLALSFLRGGPAPRLLRELLTLQPHQPRNAAPLGPAPLAPEFTPTLGFFVLPPGETALSWPSLLGPPPTPVHPRDPFHPGAANHPQDGGLQEPAQAPAARGGICKGKAGKVLLHLSTCWKDFQPRSQQSGHQAWVVRLGGPPGHLVGSGRGRC